MFTGEIPEVLRKMLPTNKELRSGIRADVRPCCENSEECVSDCGMCQRAEKLHAAFMKIGEKPVSQLINKGRLTTSKFGSFETRGPVNEIMFDLKRLTD